VSIPYLHKQHKQHNTTQANKETKTQNTKHKTQNTKHKTQNTKHKTQNTKHVTRTTHLIWVLVEAQRMPTLTLIQFRNAMEKK
jgi:hypothetical protein